MSLSRRLFTAGLAAGLLTAGVDAAEEAKKNPVVVLETTLGVIHIELNPAKAPVSVKNFLDYVQAGHYNGLIFHRVIPGFMIQGGGMTAAMDEKETRPPIKNEAGNGLKNDRGTLAMARTSVVDSATSQFFINVSDNAFLNHKDETPQGFGYAVFGKVTKGLDVVDKIVAVETTSKGSFQNVPQKAVVITSAKVQK